MLILWDLSNKKVLRTIPAFEVYHPCCFLQFVVEDLIDLFSLYVLFSHFRPRDVLKGIFLLFFHKLMRTYSRA